MWYEGERLERRGFFGGEFFVDVERVYYTAVLTVLINDRST